MNITLNMRQEGFFIPEISGGKRGKISLPPTKNLILNSGIAKLLSSGVNVLQYVSVGTGNSPPTAGQLALDARIATTNRNADTNYRYVPIESAPEAYGETIFSVQFARGQAAGNLAEVSVGWTSDGTENWSRALFKDALGNPTVITIMPDEFLKLTYVLRRYVPATWTGLMEYDNDGVPATTTVTVAPGNNTGISGLGSGGNLRTWGSSSLATFAFGTNPQFNKLNWSVFFGLEQGNPQISSVQVQASGLPQLIPAGTTISFSPAIPKTNEFDVSISLQLTVAGRVS